MRLISAAWCALMLVTVAAEGPAEAQAAGCYCRMVPIFTLPSDPSDPPPEPYCLFFGLVFDDCEQCTNPLIYEYEEPCSKPWPCTCGEIGGCCEPLLAAAPAAAPKPKFHGLKSKVAPTVAATLPKLPPESWSAQSEMFVEFPAADGKVRQAKVFLIRVDPEACGKKGGPLLIGLGYEVTHIPPGTPKFTVKKESAQKAGPSNHAYRVHVGATQFLVLLAQ